MTPRTTVTGMIRPSRLLGAALIVAACDLPSETPRWEQTWVVPAAAVSLGVADLLPAGVGLTDDGTAFTATSSPIALAATLGELCPPCAAADGMTVPKPAFTVTLTETATLHQDLVSAALAGGSVEITLEHTFSFDPLRPAGPTGPRGYVLLVLTSEGAVVARDSISGEDRAFPPHLPLRSTLPVEPVTVSNELVLEVRIHSPAGDPTVIRSSDRLTVAVPPAEVRIARATIRATGLQVAPTRTTLGFDVDPGMLDRIRSGALRLSVRNPWDVTGRLDVRFELDDRAIERSIGIQPGSFTRRLELTGQELRDLLGASTLELVTAGQVTAAGGTLVVTPDQELVLETDLELVILVGGREPQP
jgi:hypothetical protein